jgi:hypothetical protein
MHQPPKDGDHHPSNPDGVPSARMGGRRPSLHSHNHLVPAPPGVVALAGFLVGGMVAATATGRPDGRAGDRDRHQPRRPPQAPLRAPVTQ